MPAEDPTPDATSNGDLPTTEDVQDAPNESNKVGAVDESNDPWAVLALAAGESPPKPVLTETPAVIVHDANGVGVQSVEGELPGIDTNSNDLRSNLAAQFQQSTKFLSTKIQEVDAKAGISITAREVNDQYKISEKWESTVTKSKEVSTSVKEKVAPTIQQHWGNIQQKSDEMGIKDRWSSISSNIGTKWKETTQSATESVEHFKAEQEKRQALANASGDNAAQYNFDEVKGKVVEGWTGGLNWVSSRLNKESDTSGSTDDKEMNRLDSDGLPSSFRK